MHKSIASYYSGVPNFYDGREFDCGKANYTDMAICHDHCIWLPQSLDHAVLPCCDKQKKTTLLIACLQS